MCVAPCPPARLLSMVLPPGPKQLLRSARSTERGRESDAVSNSAYLFNYCTAEQHYLIKFHCYLTQKISTMDVDLEQVPSQTGTATIDINNGKILKVLDDLISVAVVMSR